MLATKSKRVGKWGERGIAPLTANAVIVFRVSPLISAGMKASIKLGILKVGLWLTQLLGKGDIRAYVEGPKDRIGSRAEWKKTREYLPHDRGLFFLHVDFKGTKFLYSRTILQFMILSELSARWIQSALPVTHENTCDFGRIWRLYVSSSIWTIASEKND